MLKRLEVLVVNLMIFWIVASNMPGIESPHGSVGFFMVGFLYGVLIISLPEILRFFRFPKNTWGKLFIGSGLTFILLLVVSTFLTSMITISASVIGNFDFIWFTTPKILELSSPYAVAGFV